MAYAQGFAILYLVLVLWTMVRDRKVVTIAHRITDATTLFALIVGGTGSTLLLWQLAHLAVPAAGALIFASGIALLLATLKFEERFVIRSHELCGICH